MITYDDLLGMQDEALNSDLEGMDVGADDDEEEDEEYLEFYS